MKMRMTAAVVATLILSSTSAAQKLVGRDSIHSLPTPTLLDSAGLFQAVYASVGDDVFIAG